VPVSNNSGVDMASLNSMMKDFVKKQDLDSLLSRIEKVEKENKE
jgi:hypothetical protein